MKQAYGQQKRNAKMRGIEFDFTYQEWCDWWLLQLGTNWPKRRGCKKDQYVMARYYDDGPYAAHNVKCITASQNIIEYNKRREPAGGYKLPLPDEIVKAIYLDRSRYKLIARKYNVTTHQIQCIKQKHSYRTITDQLIDVSDESISQHWRIRQSKYPCRQRQT